MRYTVLAIGLLTLALGGCAKPLSTSVRAEEKLNTFDVSPPSDKPPAPGPQIAYSYTLAYTLREADLSGVQAKQLDFCAKLGPARCLVVKTSLSQDDAAGGNGETDLLIDARIANAFQKQLDTVVTGSGGSVAGRSTAAEDITKQVIDADARSRAKQALADRLLGIIKTSPGKVGDLVAAEQAYAQTQEDLDAARSLQESLRRRVAMSDISITYDARESTDAWAPIRKSSSTLGDSLAWSIAGLITFAIIALPWVAVLSLLIWGLRRLGWRWPFRWRTVLPPAA